MTKALAFLKSFFDALKSWLDYLTKRNEVRNKASGENADGARVTTEESSAQEKNQKRKPWIVISSDKIEVYKD